MQDMIVDVSPDVHAMLSGRMRAEDGVGPAEMRADY